MKSLFRQPLLHFLLIGLGFFLLFQLFGSNDESDSRIIVVDKEELMTYLQFRSKSFNPDVVEERMASLTKEEMDRLIDDYVREEVLYREAKAMGLDKEDYIIKRRMIQKVEYISQGAAEVVTELTEKQIRDYYEINKANYYIQPYATFTHLFFDAEQRGFQVAKAKAEAEKVYLNKNKTTSNEAPGRGDRFHFLKDYVERDPDFVTSHFGPSMAEAIFESTPSDKVWAGPFKSEYGYHLVLLTKKVSGRSPDLSEVIGRVTEDAQRDYTRQINDETIKEIIDGYEVHLELDGEW